MKIIPLSSLILFSLLFIFALSKKQNKDQNILDYLKKFKRICSPVLELSIAKDVYQTIDSFHYSYNQNASCFIQSKEKLRDLKHILHNGISLCHLLKKYPQTSSVQKAFLAQIKDMIKCFAVTFDTCLLNNSIKEERASESEVLRDTSLQCGKIRSLSERKYSENEVDSVKDEVELETPEEFLLRILQKTSSQNTMQTSNKKVETPKNEQKTTTNKKGEPKKQN